jgi:hypothetical protein
LEQESRRHNRGVPPPDLGENSTIAAKTPPQSRAIVVSRLNKPTDHTQEPTMKKERRWMKSVLAASTEVQVAMPWARGARRRPQAMKPAAAQPVSRALAAR